MHSRSQTTMIATLIMVALITSFSSAQETLRLGPFTGIEVHNGAHVVLRPATTHRVTLLKGSMEYSRVVVTDAGELVIDKCPTRCPKGYEFELEVSAPTVSRISVMNSGRIESTENFPRQGELAVAVNHGGTIDVRSIVADRVTASVNQGGGIMTAPRVSLLATVFQGGFITYWGDPQVKSSVEHGGAVQKAN